MDKMKGIEAQAETFAKARSHLLGLVNALEEGIEQLKRDNLPAIRKSLAKASDEHKALAELIAAAPELFKKPRTVVMSGIKLGYEKGKGRIAFDDDEKVIAAIRKKLPEQAEVLIETVLKVKKAALGGLAVADLKAIGCTVEEAGDVVVIRPAGSDVNKLVAALVKGRQEETQEA